MLSTMPSHPAAARSHRNENHYEHTLEQMETVLDLLIGGRVVVLHSPFCEEQSALVQSALVPWLCEESFRVLPIISLRCQFDMPGYNRYLLSTLVSLEAALPASRRLSLAELSRLSLVEYLDQRKERLSGCTDAANDDEEVLIFDHFEDLLKTDPDDLNAKFAFFAQLRGALGQRRALLSMCETYLADLLPYRRLLPALCTNTFRLDMAA